ncbi:FAD-dependent oxidoreductase [Mycobacterium angelicum]|uniref:FAD-binding domain-containing protein n=1 Tax=Mycobacterium angelicum TaxID=470074 RepID=A0A1W9ZWY3_MYCAN|nr:NAD(P)/FAD-dependent oxidoreductase [Mycobacterium angelicum]MCV7199757.1 FAD-dependent monooxygenase [Mycobacterium angelicum]ORA22205.1 hypothetical protein BST12_10445 [Mycobacterium angelicum]
MKPHAVIVGAGPVGVVAALLLAGNDVDVTLLERNEELVTTSHAATFHPSTLDLLQTLDIDLAAAPGAITVTSLQWRDNRADIRAELDYRLLSELTKHPFRIHLDQQALLDRAAGLLAADPAIDFHCGAAIVNLDPELPSVTVLVNDGRHHTITADVVIGCDGSHSLTRRLAGIALAVRNYPTTALRAYARADLAALLPASAARPLSGLCYFRGEDDGLSTLRMAADTRLIVRSTGERPDAVRVAQAIANATPWAAYDLAIDRVESYQLGRGVVDSYLSGLGPVLVIGDAAHVTSTAGGLNMNSGLHDAFALMPAVADWLHRRVDKSVVAGIAETRRHYLLEHVIPRTERRVRGLQDNEHGSLATHLDDVASLTGDRDKARQFLIEASLLDTPLPLQAGL